MIDATSLEDQLNKIHFKGGWNSPETKELATILLPDEEIFECVNGWYEGGYALLCATSIRVLLIDKKPLNFLTIEDLRFDTINQIDYNHRMFNASICITAGLKNLTFRSYNKPRLRDLIHHVQHRMAELKRIEQVEREKHQSDLSTMDEQVKAYILDQYDQQQSLKKQTEEQRAPPLISVPRAPAAKSAEVHNESSSVDLYKAAIKEMFGKRSAYVGASPPEEDRTPDPIIAAVSQANNIEVNPLRVACSKLPMILRIRRQTLAQNPIW